jgi:16S rRNA (cytosine1402-N4)-methyltransferase
MIKMDYHNAVLLKETVEGLNIKPNGTYVDVTFGGGGHSKEILKHLDDRGRLIAFDQDQHALLNTINDERFLLINENFRYVKRFLRFHGVTKVDGITGDFGVSSHQFDKAERGFSTRFDARLDMRMNQNNQLTAYTVVNDYEEQRLRGILKAYGELRQAPLFARTIVANRNQKPILTTQELKAVLKPLIPERREHKILAQVYQAIRIEVNQEIDVLKDFLSQTPDILVKGGRLSLISYHSLEDRLVKRFMRDGLFEGQPEKDAFGNVDVPFKRVGRFTVPSPAELKINNRARSAKLRIAEKL